jgi:hypothetical protein
MPFCDSGGKSPPALLPFKGSGARPDTFLALRSRHPNPTYSDMRKANNNRDRNTRVLQPCCVSNHPSPCCLQRSAAESSRRHGSPRARLGGKVSLNLSFFAAAVVLKLAAGAFRANNQEYIGNWISVVGFYWQLTPPFLRWLKF